MGRFGKGGAVRRWVGRGVVLLVLGALVNVGVAWACALWSEVDPRSCWDYVGAEPSWVAGEVPKDWPEAGEHEGWETSRIFSGQLGFGVDIWTVTVHRSSSNGFWWEEAPQPNIAVISAGWPVRSLCCRTVFPWNGARDQRAITRNWSFDHCVPAPHWAAACRLLGTEGRSEKYAQLPAELRRAVPLAPKWCGLVFGTLFYATALTSVWIGTRPGAAWLMRSISNWIARWRARPARCLRAGAAFLFAGVLVNVVIAWGCAIWAPAGQRFAMSGWHFASDLGSEELDSEVVADWIEPPRVEASSIAEWRLLPGPGIRVFALGHEDFIGNPPFRKIDRVLRVRAGWPLAALEGSAEWDESSGSTSPQLEGATLSSAAETASWMRATEIEWSGIWSRPRRALTSRLLPLRPMWVGLVGGSVFWALVLLIGREAGRSVRAWRRRRRGGCVRCGYLLSGLPRCPECGTRTAFSGTTQADDAVAPVAEGSPA